MDNNTFYPFISTMGLAPLVANVYCRLYEHSQFSATNFRQLMVLQPIHVGETSIDYMNRLWRYQLTLPPHETRHMEERSALCLSYDESVWLDRFEKMVLPAILAHNLPLIGV